ncbi:hypothetical protein [Blastococcus sp. CT_GayMR16]|uniref:hypothetical protein n=1 Tax=Blastococcus sp. CT_GayMR16 TaxID=2559607 RepID=UPI0010734114|nr:hypothetical protein [Blastococcus sp. CT_GayMR16]TFV91411.1 hypothetical protein E4P38_02145 [Blastococcus sp. CT_GayMR16]
MNPTSGQWRDLVFGAGTDFRVRTVEGWEDLPPSRYEKKSRTQGHGAHPSKVWGDERIVTVEGWCWSSAERDAQLAAFQRRMTFDGGEEPLAITVAGRTLTAWAQLITARPMLIRGEWGLGRFGWLVQWRCPDPRRYGAIHTLSTGLPTSGGGLVLPMFSGAPGVGLDFGALGNTGQIVLPNAGTAEASILFKVRGELPQGYEISATGQRLTYPVAVPPGQVVELNTADGSVLVEGTASRRGNLTVADWMQVPPADATDGTAGTLTVQLTSLGGAYDAAAQLEALVVDTYW